MRKLQNITDEAIQRHTILLPDSEVVLELRFYPRNQMWCFNASRNGWAVRGLKLSLGVLHVLSQNQPFDFVVVDNSGSGLDPFRITDFSSGRCSLYLLEAGDMFDIRGLEVPT